MALDNTPLKITPSVVGGTKGTTEILVGSFNDVVSRQITTFEASFPVIKGNVKTEAQAAGITPFANGEPTLANIQMYTEKLVGIFVPSTPAIKAALANNIQDAFGSLKADVLGLFSGLGIESKEIKGNIRPSEQTKESLAETKKIAAARDANSPS